MARRKLDLGTVVALSWAFIAVGLTVLMGPQLGLRGWTWLGIHNVLCVLGVSHELWRGWKRHKARVQAAAKPPPEPLDAIKRPTPRHPTPRSL